MRLISVGEVGSTAVSGSLRCANLFPDMGAGFGMFVSSAVGFSRRTPVGAAGAGDGGLTADPDGLTAGDFPLDPSVTIDKIERGLVGSSSEIFEGLGGGLDVAGVSFGFLVAFVAFFGGRPFAWEAL